jgi:hypothetical protein
MRALIAGVVLAAAASPAIAQNPDEAAALGAIERLFEGMRTADTVLVRAQFAEGARFAMVGSRAEPGKIVFQSVDGWIRAIGNSNKRWDERIENAQIRVDGNIAQAWTPYAFYLDKALRHCGVNSIELLKDASGAWKITQLSDTQRQQGCKEIPPK